MRAVSPCTVGSAALKGAGIAPLMVPAPARARGPHVAHAYGTRHPCARARSNARTHAHGGVLAPQQTRQVLDTVSLPTGEAALATPPPGRITPGVAAAAAAMRASDL